MVLALGAGFGLRALTGWQAAPWVGLFAGLLAAPLVPGKAACAVRPRRGDRTPA